MEDGHFIYWILLFILFILLVEYWVLTGNIYVLTVNRKHVSNILFESRINEIIKKYSDNNSNTSLHIRRMKICDVLPAGANYTIGKQIVEHIFVLLLSIH